MLKKKKWFSDVVPQWRKIDHKSILKGCSVLKPVDIKSNDLVFESKRDSTWIIPPLGTLKMNEKNCQLQVDFELGQFVLMEKPTVN